MITTRLGTPWGLWVWRGEFHHRLNLKFRAWHEHLARKVPEEGVMGESEIYHTAISFRLTEWTTA